MDTTSYRTSYTHGQNTKHVHLLIGKGEQRATGIAKLCNARTQLLGTDKGVPPARTSGGEQRTTGKLTVCDACTQPLGTDKGVPPARTSGTCTLQIIASPTRRRLRAIACTSTTGRHLCIKWVDHVSWFEAKI